MVKEYKNCKISKENYDWLRGTKPNQLISPNQALDTLRLGEKLDDPKYWELKSEINKIKKILENLQEIVNQKTGGY